MPPLPLAPGSISLRMYPHDLPGRALVEELCAQAKAADAAGFDGLMTSEHHGGFPGYLPNPLQVAGFLLGVTERAWAAPCPLLLPLRHWSHVAEDIAWLALRFPGRVGAGFAAGGLDRDFELAELPYEENLARFKAGLPRIVDALGGRSPAPLGDDAGLAACAEAPVPVVSAAQSPAAVRRAAKLGIGVLYDSLQTRERVRELSAAHREAGGRGSRILIRRVWLGEPPTESVESQMQFYRSYTSDRTQSSWGSNELISATDGSELAERLADALSESDCDALNLRVHLTRVPPERVREQIDALGEGVLPELRARIEKKG